MCEQCDRDEQAEHELTTRLIKRLYRPVFDELMSGAHPAPVISVLAKLLASVVAGGDPRCGRDAVMKALFHFMWQEYLALKEQADDVRREQLAVERDVDVALPGRTIH
jgi:hypothetical protein